MIKGKKVLAVIPARGGSKGIARKNIRNVAGKPLLAWTVEEARKSQYIDRLVLSSEDEEIIETAKGLGCEVPFVRPFELARDDTPGVAPILHAVDCIQGYDIVVMLQVTSPLRTVYDIDRCINLLFEKEANALVSVTSPDKSPYWMYTVDHQSNRMTPLLNLESLPLRRQDLKPAYALNGAVYVAKIDWFREHKSFLTEETIAYIMPKDRSFDIDTEMDLSICDFLLKQRA
ncbi:cytidylyltransferase domain-containing protein [Paenibacillus thermotolerans]|uniref:acylneuraminate cytidylyltransferase family protein n=1 Tax=Paenibacillus thermotolerans TaxID=3027807 RepID=UPI00236763A3|nr:MULTISPECIES: acylneuraminate cytidylyltransferase family protein [unclassified Paenibacillus]